MTEATARFLVSAEGAALLALGAPELEKRRGLDPELRAGALTVLDARGRAQRRGFPHAEQLYLTPELVAQASSPRIAAWHAEQLRSCGSVVDCCCGGGLDALAFARAGLQVTAIEQDPARAVLARANTAVAGVAERVRVVQGDCTQLDWSAAAAYFDPARRDTTARVSRHAERYAPPLSFFTALRARVRVALAKLSPALPDDLLESLGGQVLFVSEERTCKEACVRLEEGGAPGPAAALLLPSGARYAAGAEAGVADTVGAYLCDPDPALVRAGALGALGLPRIAASDAYLTAEEPIDSPAVRCYRVLQALPYRERTLGRWLRDQGVGRLIVKKRHYPKEPDAVHRELGLKGKGAEATLVIVAQGKSWLGVVCEPVTGGGHPAP